MSPEARSSESGKDRRLYDEPEGAVNAEHSSYLTGLIERGIYFADDEPDKYSSNIKTSMKDISAQRPNYAAPSHTAARELRIIAGKALNKSEVVLSVLPMIVPIRELLLDDDISTTPNEKWHRSVMIRPDELQMLTAPKPNRTIGWSRNIFDKYPNAMRCLGNTVCPVAGNYELSIPLFTIEVEGPEGSSKVVRLQNLHNGAVMLANLLKVWNVCLGENTDGFFNKVHAMSLEVTAETVHLSCYWARKEKREIKYYGRSLYSWILSSTEGYKRVHRYTRNALEWVRKQALKWLCPALSALENKINTMPSPLTTPRTPFYQASAKRTRSLTSGSSLAGTSMKSNVPPAHETHSTGAREKRARRKQKRI